jgi:hypothetical protein
VPEVAEHEVAEPEVASMAAELPAKVDHGVLTGEDRQSAASLAAAWKLPKLRITPGSPSGLTVSCRWSP